MMQNKSKLRERFSVLKEEIMAMVGKSKYKTNNPMPKIANKKNKNKHPLQEGIWS